MTPPTALAASDPTLETLREVAERHRAGLSTVLAELRAWLGGDLADVEAEVADAIGPQSSRTDAARRHLLALPGKRLRAIGALLGAEAAGGDRRRAVPVAAAVELIHAATLLHDDVIDVSPLRRGQPTAHVLYGNSVSVLAGDWVLVDALQRVQSLGQPRIVSDLLAALRRIVAAEAIQLDRRGRLEPDRQVYLDIAEGKTATLFAWAFGAAARAAGAGDDASDLLEQVGRQLGVGFQIVDDVIDLAGDPAETGKAVGQDLREGKFTWPLLLAIERAPDLLDACRRLVDGEDGVVASLLETIRATGALDAAREDARHWIAAAQEGLRALPETAARTLFDDLLTSLVQRMY